MPLKKKITRLPRPPQYKRLSTWVELGAGTLVNDTRPEETAEHLRKAVPQLG
jgi:galactose-1-phosphate uridylyltransferase